MTVPMVPSWSWLRRTDWIVCVAEDPPAPQWSVFEVELDPQRATYGWDGGQVVEMACAIAPAPSCE